MIDRSLQGKPCTATGEQREKLISSVLIRFERAESVLELVSEISPIFECYHVKSEQDLKEVLEAYVATLLTLAKSSGEKAMSEAFVFYLSKELGKKLRDDIDTKY